MRRPTVLLSTLIVLALIAIGCQAATPATPDGGTGAPSDPPGPSLGPDGGGFVVPRPGQLDVREVPAELIEADVDGRRVSIIVTWTSGVEPCTILDTVIVDQEAAGYAITLREGSGPGEPVCIAIAETHRTRVDLGELEPGTYTIRDALGGAPAIEVVVG